MFIAYIWKFGEWKQIQFPAFCIAEIHVYSWKKINILSIPRLGNFDVCQNITIYIGQLHNRLVLSPDNVISHKTMHHFSFLNFYASKVFYSCYYLFPLSLSQFQRYIQYKFLNRCLENIKSLSRVLAIYREKITEPQNSSCWKGPLEID